MTHLIILLSFYVALVAQVALRYGGAGPWTPNLILLVGLNAATRARGGIAWAAAAGLVCDALTGRPLGVTMLIATLAASASRGETPGSDIAAPRRRAATNFLLIAAVESVSRLLAATVVTSPDFAAEVLAAAQTALVTAAAAFPIELARVCFQRTSPAGDARPRTPFAAPRR